MCECEQLAKLRADLAAEVARRERAEESLATERACRQNLHGDVCREVLRRQEAEKALKQLRRDHAAEYAEAKSEHMATVDKLLRAEATAKACKEEYDNECAENANLRREAEKLRGEIITLTQDHDIMRDFWKRGHATEIVKMSVEDLRSALTHAKRDSEAKLREVNEVLEDIRRKWRAAESCWAESRQSAQERAVTDTLLMDELRRAKKYAEDELAEMRARQDPSKAGTWGCGYVAQIRDLEEKVDIYRKKVDALTKELDDCRKNLDTKTLQLHASQAASGGLAADLANERMDKRRALSTVKDRDAKIESLNKIISEQDKWIGDSRDTVDKLRDQLKDATEANDRAEESISTLKSSNACLRRKVEDLEEELAHESEEADAARRGADSHLERAEKAERQLSQLSESYTNLEDRLNAVTAQAPLLKDFAQLAKSGIDVSVPANASDDYKEGWKTGYTTGLMNAKSCEKVADSLMGVAACSVPVSLIGKIDPNKEIVIKIYQD